jgi:ABC-type branched-subunit amino acid transport system substrate-binding protein
MSRNPGALRLLGLAAFAVLLVALIAGCGGGGSSSSSTASEATGGEAATTETASAEESGSSSGAEGSPIKFMTIVPLSGNNITYPAEGAAAEATVASINAEGGIAGHPIELHVCDDKNDPNEATKCAREAVEEKAVGVVGSYSLFGENIMSVLSAANIPYVSPCCASSHGELTDPNSFITSSGALISAGTGVAAGEKYKNVSFVLTESPYSEFGKELVEDGLKAAGYKGTLKTIEVPGAATDYAGTVAEATEGTDAIILGLGQQQSLAFLPALKQAGATQKLIGIGGNSLAKSVIEKNPEITEGATIVDYYPPITNAAWKPFVDAWEKYATPDQQKSDDISLLGAETTWIGYNIAKQVGEEIEGEITSSSFLEALEKASKVETGGVTPPIDFTKPFPSPEFSALYNTSVTFEEVKNGEITWPDEEFHDMGPVYLEAQK